MEKSKNEKKGKIGEDLLKNNQEDRYNLEEYGEMVPTIFGWMEPDEQGRRIKEIDMMVNEEEIKREKEKHKE